MNRAIIEIEQAAIGQASSKRETHVAKAVGQFLINIVQFAAARGGVGGDELIIGPPDLLVELQVGRAAQAAALRVLVKNSADEERIIADVRAQKKSLFRGHARQRDQHVGNVLLRPIRSAACGARKTLRARKCFQERSDVIAEFAIGDSGLLQDVTGEDVKIKLRGNREMTGVGEDRIDQARMIEHDIARLGIAEQIDQRNLIGLRTRQGAHDEIEIRGREPLPTIRPDHRNPIMSNAGANWQEVLAKITKKAVDVSQLRTISLGPKDVPSRSRPREKARAVLPRSTSVSCRDNGRARSHWAE